MILPCIDLQGRQVVQLVQGRDLALVGGTPSEMLERFADFNEIQVIDLDAAIGHGANDDLVEFLCSRARCRVGGGVRTVERARTLKDQGAHRIIVGTSAFAYNGVNALLLQSMVEALGKDKLVIALDSKGGKVVVKGWRESMRFSAEEVIRELEPYCGGFLCTYVDKEGMLQGTDLDWFRRLRESTSLEITAAGGITTMEDVRALTAMGVHCALGMAIYTGRLNLADLAEFNRALSNET
jgi:phosphoribosylformimino-5-aminoimidazole carboxamide ribotide isomerase